MCLKFLYTEHAIHHLNSVVSAWLCVCTETALHLLYLHHSISCMRNSMRHALYAHTHATLSANTVHVGVIQMDLANTFHACVRIDAPQHPNQ